MIARLTARWLTKYSFQGSPTTIMSGSAEYPGWALPATFAEAANSSGTPRLVPVRKASELFSGGSVLRHTGTRSLVVRAMSAIPDQS